MTQQTTSPTEKFVLLKGPIGNVFWTMDDGSEHKPYTILHRATDQKDIIQKWEEYCYGKRPAIFNEQTLRADIAKTWGEAGAHMDVYNKILKAALNYSIKFPVTIQTTDKGPIEVNEGTAILFDRGKYWLLAFNKEIEFPKSEFERLWPVISFKEIVGKRGAFFKLKKR